MKTVIRRRETREYLGESGWTTDRAHAIEFASGFDAVISALKLRMGDIEIVHLFENPAYDFVVWRSDSG